MTDVYIVNGNSEYTSMFEKMKWKITDNLFSAKLIQFTGGCDVTPAWYNQQKHSQTSSSLLRDQREAIIFKISLKNKIPMSGICRGGQFLNIMNGGDMWQHVKGHVLSQTHNVVDMLTGESFQATSTHHQVMKPNIDQKDMLIVLEANESHSKEIMSVIGSRNVGPISVLSKNLNDVEAIYYEDSKCFCFQPHPEFVGTDMKELRQRYFDYLNEYLGI